MNLTRHTDFGLRVLMALATAAPNSPPISTTQIAKDFNVSLTHLQKVVQALSHNGFINTSRGRGGGLTLARPANEIVVGEVVRALEPDLNLVDCMAGGPCTFLPGCGLKPVLGRATHAFLVQLDKATLADVTKGPVASKKQSLKTKLEL